MLNYVEIFLNIKFKIFNIIPIEVLKINNEKAKKIIEKQKEKNKRNLKKNKDKNKQIAKNVIIKYLKIDKINASLSVCVYNASFTALSTSFLIIFFSIILSYITDEKIKKYKNKLKQEYYIRKNFKYEIKPIYKDDLILNIKLTSKFSIKIFSILKESFMYKNSIFVNNTNKYSVKES